MNELMYTGAEFLYGQDTDTRGEFRRLGLLDGSPEAHLTAKGREWLKVLEEVEVQEISDNGERAADLVMSTSGLLR